MSLQHLKEQEIAEFAEQFDLVELDHSGYDKGKPATVIPMNDSVLEWLKQHDLRLEQAIREDERSKFREILESKKHRIFMTDSAEYKKLAEFSNNDLEDIEDILLTLK